MQNELNEATVWLGKVRDWAIEFAPKLLAALLVLWIGSILIGFLGRMLNRATKSRGVEPTLQRFLHSLITISLKVLLLITFVSMLGVQTTSFIAIIGAAGLAIGLALQGTLANFAGGTLILLFRPYKVGDLVETQGVLGNVKEIQIFTTVLVTPDNKTAIVPNGPIANGNIINYSREGKIRVDLTFGLNYAASLPKAREVLMGVMTAHPKVLQDPAPSVNIAQLNLEGAQLAVRPYAAPEDYWTVYFDIYEQGLAALQAAGVAGPQPSMRVLTEAKA